MSKKLNTEKIVSFDIDGVLNNYPKCFIDYVNILTKTKFKSIEAIKKKLSKKNYEKIKDKYRRSNYKYNLKINSKIIKIINKISKKYRIQIVTSRPFYKYKKMYKKTAVWLKKNKIKNFNLYYKKKNVINEDNVTLHIDDQEKDIHKVYNHKTHFFLLSKNITKKKKKYCFSKKK